MTNSTWIRPHARQRWSPLVLAILLLPSGLAVAQPSKGGPGGGLGSGGLSLSAQQHEQVSLSAEFEVERGSRRGRLHVTAELNDGWHLYSVSQQPGGPQPTKIRLVGDTAKLTGPFSPDSQPETKMYDVWPGLPVEEHGGEVSWTAPFEFSESSDPEQLSLEIQLDGQVCLSDGACVPVKEEFEASFAGYYGTESKLTELRAKNTHAVWSAELEPNTAKPGDSATLTITAVTDEGYHVYPFVPGDDQTEFRTLIVASNKAGLKFGEPETDAPLVSQDIGLDEPVRYHKSDVQWSIPITVPENAGLGEHPIELLVGFMTCDDRSCDAPAAIRLTGVLTVADTAAEKAQSLAMGVAPTDYRDVAGHANLNSWIDAPQRSVSERSAGAGLELWMVLAALAGGFILNFMPCVLPVIGLKLMSFVNQGGTSHSRVVSLNLSFVGGIISVMLILAALNIGAKLAGEAFGWGQQFTRIEFQVPLAALIFAMALSFLGVWEIPIPGFATTSKSGELMAREGLDGAFYKGILTTVLATPCSGPFLGSIFGLTMTLSVGSILMLYIIVGLGLGLPYLALCFYPKVLQWMPKPGPWMETLKQILAFPLLLTVVFFLSMITPDYRIATLILLIVIWFACWSLGRIPAYADRKQLATAWSSAVGTVALGAFVAFSYFGPTTHHLDWKPYNETALAQYREQGKTVMLEFTARWCLTCQSNMKLAIDRPNVAELVEENDVVPMLADWSEPDPEIFAKIQELDSLSIPLLAIYPPDPSAEPIILRDTITESQLLEALREAGPSVEGSAMPSSPEEPPKAQLTSTHR